MKDYKKFVIWADYFDSSVTRKQGRRVPFHSAVRSPTLNDLAEAARRLGFEPEQQPARRPSRTHAIGYIQIVKKGKKSEVIKLIAKELAKRQTESKRT
ncbi:MAG: signal recognition particle subunit SRP19/SEC65 family protein [Nitrososphaerota archaeon]